MRIYDIQDTDGNLKPLVKILGDWAWAAMGLVFIAQFCEGFLQGVIMEVQKPV